MESANTEKALRFQALHQREDAFIIPNPWDVGTARLLAGMGFAALATTSAGYAFSRGLPDGSVGRPEALAYAAAIAAGATELPVNGDLEKRLRRETGNRGGDRSVRRGALTFLRICAKRSTPRRRTVAGRAA